MTSTPTLQSIQQRFGLQLEPGEALLNLYTRHWIVLVRRSALFLLLLLPVGIFLSWLVNNASQGINLPLLLVVCLYLVSISLLWYYGYADWRNDALIMTDRRLLYIEQTLLLSYAVREALLSNVQNVRSTSKGLLASLLHYGHLLIETAARQMDISFGPIPHPEKAQQDIMARLEELRAEISRQHMEQILRRHLYGEETPPPPPPPPPSRRRWSLLPPNPLIEGKNITWHKHWFFLLRRLLVPILLLALALASFFFLPRFAAPGWVYSIPVAFILVFLFVIIWRYQVWMGDIYTLTETQLLDIYRTPWGLFGEERRTGELSRIQNISFRKPGILAWILNFGDVRIQTAGAEDFTFGRVPRPEEVQREIYRRQQQARQREEEKEEERIARYLAVYRDLEREHPQE